MTVMVTGGVGYIGSHVLRLLTRAGTQAVVVDDLSTGLAERAGGAPLLRVDLATDRAPEELSAAMLEHEVTAVIHFAARKQVGESVSRPAWYHRQNVGGMANLLLAMEAAGVAQLVFSSSAAVYGAPDADTVGEDLPPRPINPYGETKLVGEWLVSDAARAWGLSGVSLRYFNVAGAGWPDLGDPAEFNLIPIVLGQLSRGATPTINGDGYPTPDGTCIRDYVHVQDLAEAHVAALGYLRRPERQFDVFNVGTGQGASVREVISSIASRTGHDIEPAVGPPRPGDPARLVANVSRIEEIMGWKASRGLEDMIETAWAANPARQPVEDAT